VKDINPPSPSNDTCKVLQGSYNADILLKTALKRYRLAWLDGTIGVSPRHGIPNMPHGVSPPQTSSGSVKKKGCFARENKSSGQTSGSKRIAVAIIMYVYIYIYVYMCTYTKLHIIYECIYICIYTHDPFPRSYSIPPKRDNLVKCIGTIQFGGPYVGYLVLGEWECMWLETLIWDIYWTCI